jgi:Domain of unknown function (DUF4189)
MLPNLKPLYLQLIKPVAGMLLLTACSHRLMQDRTMNTKAFFIVGLLSVSGTSFAANGCPYGESPTGPRSDANPLGCVPDPQADNNGQPAQPSGRWETRWGAIATDGTVGRFGAVINYSSKRQAVKAAMKQCIANGGGKACKSRISFYNQCAAIAWGNDSNYVQGAETIEIASRLALEACDKLTANCKIAYAQCSLPVWVQ